MNCPSCGAAKQDEKGHCLYCGRQLYPIIVRDPDPNDPKRHAEPRLVME